MRFDFNPLNLRSAKAESVATLLDLMQDPRTSPNTVEILKPSLEEADALAEKLRGVARSRKRGLDSPISFPRTRRPSLRRSPRRAALSRQASLRRSRLAAPDDADDVKALSEAGAELRKAAGASVALAPLARMGASLLALSEAPEMARQRARKAIIAPMLALLADTALALQAGPVTLENLPAVLKIDWLAADGRARLEVFPRGEQHDNETLRRFVGAVRKIAPDASGAPVSILESGDTVVRAFVEAGAMALVSISLLLYLALRRIGDVLLTLAPLLLAGVYTMEISVLIDLKLNFANIIALPLLLGLGVAFKIYYVMAWRAGTAELLQTSLTRAIFFSAMTTATAFGSLWASSHPGTSSMGKLLALSLATTLCAAVFFQPALMGPPRKADGA